MADITKVFRAAVTALELRKGGGRKPPEQPSSSGGEDSSTRRSGSQDEFAAQSRRLHACLAEARGVVQSAQADPSSSSSQAVASSQTGAAERAATERDIARMLAACDAGLTRLAGLAGGEHSPAAASQALAHRREAVQILRERLQAIAASHRAACHMRRRRARLQADFVPASLRQRARPQPLQPQPQPDDPMVSALSPVERAALQQESLSMLNELTALSGDVKQVEAQLAEIASLQTQFGERVVEQEAQIDHVHTETVSSVENVRSGNEQLRQAMQNKASLRFWLLFYLIVTSLTLWFLDWYND